MNWAIYIFGSGLALFVGVSLLLVAVIPSIGGAKRVRLRTLLAVIGIIFLALSAAPLPLWSYGTIGVLLLAWLTTVRGGNHAWERANFVISILLFIALVAVLGSELRFQFPSPLTPTKNRQLYLFGDSLAAGIGNRGEDNWPEIMSQAHQLKLVNISSPGDTAKKAAEKARTTRLIDGLVLLEIGGNDLLGGASLADFERDLDELLTLVRANGRQVVMFELPLPPFHNGYGLVQRRLAARHRVRLIPKRVLMGVIATQGATVDSLHLSPTGHQLLADATWPEIAPAFD